MALYRAEVALAVFVAGYVVVLLLWMAYHGQAAHIELPGGTSIDPATAQPLPLPQATGPDASEEGAAPSGWAPMVPDLDGRAEP